MTLIDSETDKAFLTTRSLKTGKVLHLAASDEFSRDGRSFKPGQDSIFEAIDQPDFTNNAMQYYDSSYVTTKDGMLVISTTAKKTSWNDVDPVTGRTTINTRNYTSGMVQSWNKFCFTGGVLELSVQLPGGRADAGGLWPAAWLMGNLARAIFPKSTMAIWPWSYDKCGDIAGLPWKQEINACDDAPGHGLHPHQGRGSPEIDLFEVMLGHAMPGKPHVPAFMSSSLQISPGIDKSVRPHNGHKLNNSVKWYEGIDKSNTSEFNFGFWGQWCGPEVDNSFDHRRKYLQDAISVNTNLHESHFQDQHLYRLEWEPDAENGYLQWYLDSELVLSIDAASLEATGSQIPLEPMYLILNTAVSHSWGFPEPCDIEQCNVCYKCYDCTNPACQCALPEGMQNCGNLPAEMKVDYIRLYQDRKNADHTLSCSPPRFPTSGFIKDFSERYVVWDSAQKIRIHDQQMRGIDKYFVGLGIFVVLAAVFLDLFIFHKFFTLNSLCKKPRPPYSNHANSPGEMSCVRDRSGASKSETLPLLKFNNHVAI